MGAVHTSGPNKCLVISGGCRGSQQLRRFIIGGHGWAWWCVTEVQYLPLSVMTVMPKCEGILTVEGVPLYVTGVAQVKVMKSREYLERAAEQFLDKKPHEIAAAILQTLEGHLRAILGTLTVEEAYKDRRKFADLVRKVASTDVSKMGIDIVSFVIKEISDDVSYLRALGKTQTAVVKRDARIGVAESNRDAGIIEAECEKSLADSKFVADASIAEAERGYKVKQSEYDVEVNTKHAEAKLAYELQVATTNQQIRAEEMAIDVIERKKEIGVEEKEIMRREKELEAVVKLPAVAESYRIEQMAEGHKTQQIAAAAAEAERIRCVGEAEATVVESVGAAEAEGMRLKANAFKQYGEVAVIKRVIDSLPAIAAETSAPLAKIDEIVILGEDKTTSEVTKLIAQLPPAVRAVTGVDLSQVIAQIPGAKASA